MSSTTSRSRSVSQDIIVVLALLTPPAPGRDRLLKSREGKSGASANTKLLAAETPRKSSI
jgi:hypothetical protein